ncbi:hypothetical protein [Pseudomonas guariconensis]|uniref:hypothetical protein n=1 Tax=Pseudomonas guariconensis TaxID=1288410 RepID=UPI0039064CAD
MNRYDFDADDIRKFSSIGKHLVKNLSGFETDNADKLREFVAQVTLFRDMHEATSCVGRGVRPAPGTITRADVRLFFAAGVSRLTGIPLTDAYRRAVKARLDRLSIDRYTVERLREEQIREQRNKWFLLTPDEIEVMRRPSLGWHEDYPRLVANGAPPYSFTVRHDGLAFDWFMFIDLYDAIRVSRYKPLIIDPSNTFDDEDQAMDAYLRDVLIPQLWQPLEAHIEAGHRVPFHEVVWVFDEHGAYVGRMIRHTAHGSYLPRLLLTEQDVVDALAMVQRGGVLQHGSTLTQYLSPPRNATLPVFTLKQGVRHPGSINDPFQEVSVDVEQLQLIPGLHGNYWGYSQGGRPKKNVWIVTGDLCRTSADGWTGRMTANYLESVAWLTENDLPRLFPNRAITGAREPGPFNLLRNQRTFLPAESLELQERAEQLLDVAVRDSLQSIALMMRAPESIGRLNSAIGAPALLELFITAGSSTFSAHLEAIGRQANAAVTVNVVKDVLATRFPALGGYGAYTLWAALTVHWEGEPAGQRLAHSIALEEVVVGLLVLQSHFMLRSQVVFIPQACLCVAVGEWVEGMITLESVPAVAREYKGYRDALYNQAQRIARIQAALDVSEQGRKEAYLHGFAYVGTRIPRSKPQHADHIADILEHITSTESARQ